MIGKKVCLGFTALMYLAQDVSSFCSLTHQIRKMSLGDNVQKANNCVYMSSSEGASGKVALKLGEYKNKALTVTVSKGKLDEKLIEKGLKELNKDYELVAARFCEGKGGARVGHTVLINWKAKYQGGGSPELVKKGVFKRGHVIPGTDQKLFELDLKEDHEEPWATFTTKIGGGMGQDEFKVFDVHFPEDNKNVALRGVQASIECTVKRILDKVPKTPDPRSEEDKRAAVIAELMKTVEMKEGEALDRAIREALLPQCEVDVEKVANSVSWAKFGEKSLEDFRWQLVCEAIAAKEGIAFTEVAPLLRKEAVVERVE